MRVLVSGGVKSGSSNTTIRDITHIIVVLFFSMLFIISISGVKSGSSNATIRDIYLFLTF